jgi:hypothetical protein
MVYLRSSAFVAALRLFLWLFDPAKKGALPVWFRQIGPHRLLALLVSVVAPMIAQPPDANYDESKVPAYRLPDPLLFENGRRVTTWRMWLEKRRPELLKIFETNVYGHSPAPPSDPVYTLISDDLALNGTARRKQVKVQFSRGSPASMTILLYLPAHDEGRVPVFVGLNFKGNQTVQSDPGILLSTAWVDSGPGIVNHRSTEASRGSESTSWPVPLIVSSGYAVATVYDGDIAPDHANNEKEGVFAIFAKPGSAGTDDARAPDEWGTIAAWAWGLSRIADYLETDAAIDKFRMIVIGHSRLGKAALWAGAQDTRFAAVVSNDSGEGGAAIARRKFGERTANLNTVFPHWYARNYRKYNDKEEDLPVDSNQLLSLIAPRPLYVASASEDLWADPKGEFLGALGADPVYRLFGGDGLAVKEMPSVEQPVFSTIGYHLRRGKHAITEYDWTQCLTWASTHLHSEPLGIPVAAPRK